MSSAEGRYERHPKNAPGDFYVAHNCCTQCEAPCREAPDLIGMDEDGCFFRRQPANVDELSKAIDALNVSCMGALRYCGDNPAILEHLREYAEDACDYGPKSRPPWAIVVIEGIKWKRR